MKFKNGDILIQKKIGLRLKIIGYNYHKRMYLVKIIVPDTFAKSEIAELTKEFVEDSYNLSIKQLLQKL